jgi:hypothetical protein
VPVVLGVDAGAAHAERRTAIVKQFRRRRMPISGIGVDTWPGLAVVTIRSNCCLTHKVQLRSALAAGAVMLTVLGYHQAHNLMSVAPSVATNVR